MIESSPATDDDDTEIESPISGNWENQKRRLRDRAVREYERSLKDDKERGN